MSRNTNAPLPPVSMVEALMPEVTASIAETERLRTEAGAAQRALRKAEAALEQAKEADTAAVADHARGLRKQEPKPTVPKAREAAELAALRCEGLRRAVAGAEADLEAGLAEHREALSGRLDAELADAQHASYAAVQKLAECEAERARLLALRRWIDGGRFDPAKSASPPLELRRMSGEAYRLAEVLEVIVDALAPTEPVEREEIVV